MKFPKKSKVGDYTDTVRDIFVLATIPSGAARVSWSPVQK